MDRRIDGLTDGTEKERDRMKKLALASHLNNLASIVIVVTSGFLVEALRHTFHPPHTFTNRFSTLSCCMP